MALSLARRNSIVFRNRLGLIHQDDIERGQREDRILIYRLVHDGLASEAALHGSDGQSPFTGLKGVTFRSNAMSLRVRMVRQGSFTTVPRMTPASTSKFLLFVIRALKLAPGGLSPFPPRISALLTGLPTASRRSLGNFENGRLGRHGRVL
jgi:hypothetical protein